MRLLAGLAAAAIAMNSFAQTSRWETAAEGGIVTSLAKLTRGEAHSDHIEMGGRSVNAIIKWNVSPSGEVYLTRNIRWPMLREAKDDTHAAMQVNLLDKNDPWLVVNGELYQRGKAEEFRIDGMLQWRERNSLLTVTRTLFPSVSLPVLIEKWEITNSSAKPVELTIPLSPQITTLDKKAFAWAAHKVKVEWIGGGKRVLAPGETLTTGMAFSAAEENQPLPYPDIQAEWAGRQAFLSQIKNSLKLTTGDKEVDQLFAFSKLRAAENVLATRGGLMHAPGGFNRYLAALWCNDQNEYASPFFPFLGDPAGNESARNAYAWFAKYMNPEFKPIPSSIVAEGRGIWNGAGDRGDAAMTAYGASRWALATGDPTQAEEVWPLIKWCLDYCLKQKTSDGVIASQSDELEGRFSSGKTNLATSSLTYDGLISSAYLIEALGSELGEPASLAAIYREEAENLKKAINRHFAADVAGRQTYRYHEGLDKLRSWICIPLVMDIHEKAEGTVQTLFTPELWTEDGLLTEVGSTTYWDRSTLYALRGVFRAGFPDLAAEYLGKFTQRRLLGDHVPYAQEAYPEQNQSHLSAESALYCRILTEGAFGIRPTGLDSFTLKPSLPKAWPGMKLTSIHAFGRVWDCEVKRNGQEIEAAVSVGGEVIYKKSLPPGKEHSIKFS